MDRQSIDQHNIEIQKNLKSWESKPLLRDIYKEFYKKIHNYIDYSVEGKIVELGSGIGNIKIEIPEAISTDLFENPWIDQVENAYQLSFEDNSVSNLILFDVFHHFEYPGNAFAEFNRVLKPNGRVIIFDPSISMFGYFIYGLLHHEPVAITKVRAFNFLPFTSKVFLLINCPEPKIISTPKFLNLSGESWGWIAEITP